VQATSAGIAMGAGGVMRDAFGHLASTGALGRALAGPSASYMFVYHVELLMLFLGLAVIGPLAGYRKAEEGQDNSGQTNPGFGLSEFPR
jgi:MFS transporter, BCD family, chlorophyll transporter